LSQQYESDETTVDLDSFELSDAGDSGETTRYDPVRPYPVANEAPGIEANIILISHPEERMLGRRYRLPPHGTMEIGRSSTADISMPHVHSLSRNHARLSHLGAVVEIADMGSTNGTYVNDQLIEGSRALRSGDRFQLGAAHFKFLHEEDPEHAYHQAIYQLVMCDGLTQIYNQRKFEEELRRELSRAQRHGRPLSLMHFDIDHFKNVNDTYGHLRGSRVLREVGFLLRTAVRETDYPVRYGGDEFVVVLPQTDHAAAAALGDKLRDLIEGHTFLQEEGIDARIGLSYGVATYPNEAASKETLIRLADERMYADKDVRKSE